MVNKEWSCPKCGEFEAALMVSICPTCHSRVKRVFLTAPTITRATYQRTNKLMDDTLRAQNLTNYSNATGYGNAGKATFSNEFQHESGLVAGYGMDFLRRVTNGGQLRRLDEGLVQRGVQGDEAYKPVDVARLYPENLAAVTQAGAKINSKSHLSPRTNIEAHDPQEYRKGRR